MNDDNAGTMQDSFLEETQIAGKASGKVEIGHLDEAIASIHEILDEEMIKKFRDTKEEDLPKSKIVVYCHDCKQIVPGGVGKTLRGNLRTVCGTCKSKKISMGKEEGIKKFYHLDKKE